jgi:hypothetical protein
MNPGRVGALLLVLATPVLLASPSAASAPTIPIVNVGSVGNEPLLAVAPDGTVYISALQYVYKSVDGGKSFAAATLPPETANLTYKTDSDIAVDPGGRLYYTFDYPYAGTTAVCTTDDRAESWHCDPATVPGGTDRMWISAPSTKESFLTTNEGLYQPVFAHSADRGQTYTVDQTGSTGNNPYTSKPVAGPTGPVLQAVDVGSSIVVNSYNRAGAQIGTSSGSADTKLPSTFTVPSITVTPDGTAYVPSEAPNDLKGTGIVLGRSTDAGKTWSKLPPLPDAASGTAIFSMAASGANGHVGIAYYWTPTSHDPGSMPAGTIWFIKWAETHNADSAAPTWKITTLEQLHHTGLICRGLGCELDTSTIPPTKTTARYAGDVIGAAIGADGSGHVAWMGADRPTNGLPADPSSNYGEIHYARIAAATVKLPVRTPVKNPVTKPTATGTLAATGADLALPTAAISLLGLAIAVRRRRVRA